MAKGSRRTPKKPPTEIRADKEAELKRYESEPLEPIGSKLAADVPTYVQGDSIPVDEPKRNGIAPKSLAPNRRLLPIHIKIIHDGRNDSPQFEMGEDHRYRKMVIKFRQDPGEEIQGILERDRNGVSFAYDERQKLWHAPATPDGRQAAYEVTNEISGKDLRYGYGRGA